HTVCLSPDGLINNISFAALWSDREKCFLSEKYEIRMITTSGKVVYPSRSEITEQASFLVVGGIEYSTSVTEDHVWNFLEGTESEAGQISELLADHGFRVKLYSGRDASEGTFKQLVVAQPDVIHLATHGFFFPLQEEMQKNAEIAETAPLFRGSRTSRAYCTFAFQTDPLLRTGIVLSGANDVWNSNPVNDSEDGVLTAYEVSNLNLENTQLVVLSACETGLGDIRGSEGVYGLQRAFKMAGVKFIIMSLWQVPDKETEEFMVTFYEKLLRSKDVRRAFNETQAEMRKKYDPYFWGAFVLIQ
ncbi:MAG: CHAT domain-containing protein, partial [Bacteroidetes bacterium]|nr:CHAT domain-containing protein [Bacteroidota bacterium]